MKRLFDSVHLIFCIYVTTITTETIKIPILGLLNRDP